MDPRYFPSFYRISPMVPSSSFLMSFESFKASMTIIPDFTSFLFIAQFKSFLYFLRSFFSFGLHIVREISRTVAWIIWGFLSNVWFLRVDQHFSFPWLNVCVRLPNCSQYFFKGFVKSLLLFRLCSILSTILLW